MDVRVRYAPSPTGNQHIGGLRTALFNYFWARAAGGRFILRVEDTDRNRYSEGALRDLHEMFDWLGLSPDEGPAGGGDFGPYVQSECFPLYEEKARELTERGKAYYCFCSPERLEELREKQKAGKESVQGYDRRCRGLSPEEAEQKKAAGRPWTIRLKTPEEGKVTFEDLILGKVTRKNKDLSPDPVLFKSDGCPTYHLANVIDDHRMRITHVLRAQEWLPSTPIHLLLYRAFGWEAPLFCHLPMVLGKDGRKLSKRHGATAVKEFREGGYLPEALINAVIRLGWSLDGSTEIFSVSDLEKAFSLEKISKSPAVFDYKKLLWLNGYYIREKADEALKKELKELLTKEGLWEAELTAERRRREHIFEEIYPHLKERLKVLKDVVPLLRYLFEEIPEYHVELAIPKKMEAYEVYGVLTWAAEALEQKKDLEEWETACRQEAETRGCGMGAFMQPVRLGVTGQNVSLPLIPFIRILGRDQAVTRLRTLAEALKEEYRDA